MSRYNLFGGERRRNISIRKRDAREGKEEWNANSPAVAGSGRPMSDEQEAFGGRMVRDGYMYPVQVMRMPVIVQK